MNCRRGKTVCHNRQQIMGKLPAVGEKGKKQQYDDLGGSFCQETFYQKTRSHLTGESQGGV